MLACEKEAKDAERRGHDRERRRRRATEIRRLVEDLYAERNPAKLTDVEGLFEKYQGQEDEMYLRICTLYGVQPHPSFATPEEEVLSSRSRPSSRTKGSSPRPVGPMRPVAKSSVKPPARPNGAASGRGPSHRRHVHSRSRSGRRRRSSSRRCGDHRSHRSHGREHAAADASHCRSAGRGRRGIFEGMPPEGTAIALPVAGNSGTCEETPCCSDCGVEFCAGINFETHPVTRQAYCHECWFSGGLYREVTENSVQWHRSKESADFGRANGSAWSNGGAKSHSRALANDRGGTNGSRAARPAADSRCDTWAGDDTSAGRRGGANGDLVSQQASKADMAESWTRPECGEPHDRAPDSGRNCYRPGPSHANKDAPGHLGGEGSTADAKADLEGQDDAGGTMSEPVEPLQSPRHSVGEEDGAGARPGVEDELGDSEEAPGHAPEDAGGEDPADASPVAVDGGGGDSGPDFQEPSEQSPEGSGGEGVDEVAPEQDLKAFGQGSPRRSASPACSGSCSPIDPSTL